MENKPKKKSGHNELKRQRRKQRFVKRTILYSLIFILLSAACALIMFFDHDRVSHSDENTDEYTGVVSNIEYVNSGAKGHHYTVVYLTLDNGVKCAEEYSTFREIGYRSRDDIEKALLNQKVTVNCCKVNEENIAQLILDSDTVISYEYTNRMSFETWMSVFVLYLLLVFLLCIMYYVTAITPYKYKIDEYDCKPLRKKLDKHDKI